jgi:hypothetical protein
LTLAEFFFIIGVALFGVLGRGPANPLDLRRIKIWSLGDQLVSEVGVGVVG